MQFYLLLITSYMQVLSLSPVFQLTKLLQFKQHQHSPLTSGSAPSSGPGTVYHNVGYARLPSVNSCLSLGLHYLSLVLYQDIYIFPIQSLTFPFPSSQLKYCFRMNMIGRILLCPCVSIIFQANFKYLNTVSCIPYSTFNCAGLSPGTTSTALISFQDIPSN